MNPLTIGASSANRTVQQVVAHLAAAADLAEQWLAEHGTRCGCAFCSGRVPGTVEAVARDLEGVRWAAGLARDALEMNSLDEGLLAMLARDVAACRREKRPRRRRPRVPDPAPG